MITYNSLVRLSLKIHSVKREAVQRAEQLIFVVAIKPLNHVKVGLASIAPSTGNHLCVGEFEPVHTTITAETTRLSLKLNKVSLSFFSCAQGATIVAFGHVNLICVLKSCQANVTAQIMGLVP